MDKSETVKQMSLKPLEYSFFLPLSVQAYEEFLALENEMILELREVNCSKVL